MGYSPKFLAVPVPLPAVDGGITPLDYVHFTVLHHRARRLALATAVNIDGQQLRVLERGDDWHFDERLPETEQAGPRIYASNDLDRGHLVRRRDPVWGAEAEAAQANYDTFAFTNAAPQAALFNQGPLLWLGLEDHVLEYAQVNELKLSVFTGPMLAPDDPEYRGLQIPRRFWKIAVWTTSDLSLRAAGFVLDQSDQLRMVLRGQGLADPPPLGPFLTFQVPVAAIGELTGLAFEQLAAADVFDPAGSWQRLRHASDLRPGLLPEV